jgi:hypothetical protein
MTMSKIVTLKLPEHVVHSTRAVAAKTHQRVAEALFDWMDQGAAEESLDDLPDEAIVGLCDLQMVNEGQVELSRLLACNREDQLKVEGQGHKAIGAKGESCFLKAL